GCERFSRLFGLQSWLCGWSAINDLGFVDNWSSFWEQPALYRRDGLHPSCLGSRILSRNIESAVQTCKLEAIFRRKEIVYSFGKLSGDGRAGSDSERTNYTNIPSAYRAEPRPHLGYSDHISVMLIPAYRPLVRQPKPVLKQVRTWPSGAISALQDCFEHTDWQMFREDATYSTTTDLEEYTSSVTSYIGKCIDDVTMM
ncbi:hypothetical protein NFI96_004469, partial [Prochilodus magdalenae]